MKRSKDILIGKYSQQMEMMFQYKGTVFIYTERWQLSIETQDVYQQGRNWHSAGSYREELI